MVLKVYELTASFPRDELFGLINQMKRSSASVTANITEGFGRMGSREKEQFYRIAAGSLFELKDKLLIAHDVGYISRKNLDIIAELVNKCHAQLNALLAAHINIRTSKFQLRNSRST